MAASGYRGLALYRRVVLQARLHWRAIAGLLLLDLLATPLSLLKPVALKIAVDNVLGSKPPPWFLPGNLTHAPLVLLGTAAAFQVLVVLLFQLQAMTGHWLQTQTGEKVTLDFRARLFHHLQRLSVLFHDTRGTADSIYRVEYDAPSIQTIIFQGLLPFVSEIVMLAAMIYVMARIDWQLALVALAIAPFFFLHARNYDRRMGRHYERVEALQSRAMAVVQEVLTAVRVVKAFGREDKEQERFVRYSGEGLRAHVRLAWAEGVFGFTVNLGTAIGAALVLVIGVRGVQSGTLTLGNLLLVMAYLTELYAPLQQISDQVTSMQWSLASARRAFEIMDEVPEVSERPNARPLERARGAVEFRDVSFTYDGKRRVLRGVSFAILPGARVGIAGRTGVGKTTLFSLLVRFYDATSGRILLDGVDLRDYRLADLRNQFALVLQEPVLFSTTIAENIAYGRPGASEDEIVAAATAAGAHNFIVQLPDGYQTGVGERGMLLSGGERQRISLARAFLKDAPILILDEPTSSVDLRTEADIMEAMERLMEGRTTLFISHRPNTLRNCNVVLTLENGRLGGVPAEAGRAQSP